MQQGSSAAALAGTEPWAGSSDPLARRRYLQGLGERIAEMAAHIESATWRLLRAIAEYDRYEGWAGEFASCAHWLAYRCQWDMRTARDRVRTARALEDLPRIGNALREGRLSYSKVRAVARIGKPENEEEMLYLALNSTTEHMERIVQGYRRAAQGESLEEVAERHEARYLRIWQDADGMVVIKARLTPEVGAVVRKALEGALELVRDRGREGSAEEGRQDPAGNGHLQPGGSPGCREERVQPSRLAERDGDEIGPDRMDGGSAEPRSTLGLAAESASGAAPNARGPSGRASSEPSAGQGARAGQGPGDEVPRINLGGISGLPAWGVIDEDNGEEWVLVENPGDGGSEKHRRDEWYPRSRLAKRDGDEIGPDRMDGGSAEPSVPPLPPPGSPAFTAELLNRLQDNKVETVDQLRADALGLLAEAALGKGLGCRERGEPYQVVLHVDAALLAGTAGEGRCETDGGSGVSAETCRRLACDAPVLPVTHGKDGAVLDLGRRTRKIPLNLWRFLQERDRHCQFPGCNRTGKLQAHHIRHWAHGGETGRSNLLLVCRWHHWKLHEGGYRAETDASGGVVFLRPDGSCVPRVAPGSGVPADPMRALAERNRAYGVEITPETNHVGWGGEPLDLVTVVEGILRAEAGSTTAPPEEG